MGGIVGLRDVLVVAPAASFHHQHPHHQESYYSAAGTEHPILTAAPCLMGDDSHDPRGKSSGIHLWHQQQHHPLPQNPNPNPYHLKKPMPMLDPSGILSYGSGTATCQDCGNQAKKDCSHRRCRTCCKSRGYDCTTHVKSTWVPAARRRERQVSGGVPAANSSVSTSAPKKPRLLSSQATTSHTSTSNNTTRSYDTSSSHRDANNRESLPGQVRAPAVFKCVRVSSMDDDGEDEYAYQAMVKIGGHVFKGFLYDQGADDGREEDHSAIAAAADTRSNNNNNNNTTTTTSSIPNLSELHLGASTSGGGGRSGPMLASVIYGGGGLLGGATAYGNPIN
ncbi:protein LATERAL ROOT PRIMORDIUM 1 [Iris pallida]|uniref:Protein LATERAL ROOT PRIMORDIUM 1 n=1 Tax=Iris pallida TaxID=29817 RepID=A0AAX6FSX9_IRIPA|nr:protein LATERAL ROOT PRIMORDIUM 1 [Iris pallida]